MQLLPNDPKVLDKLKKNMKAGYVVSSVLPGQERPTDVVFTLDEKTFINLLGYLMNEKAEK